MIHGANVHVNQLHKNVEGIYDKENAKNTITYSFMENATFIHITCYLYTRRLELNNVLKVIRLPNSTNKHLAKYCN